MINDLSVKDVNDLWKYVDDSTLSESVCRDGSSNLQKYVDEFNQKSKADGFQINESKCKEIRISFTPSTREFQPISLSYATSLCDLALNPPFFLGGKMIELGKFCFIKTKFEPNLSCFSK